jgi:hypothetical protein
VKHVWGGGIIPARSIGPYTLDSQIKQAFKEMNDLLEEEKTPWRLHLEEIVDVKDIPQHFKIQGDEFAQMEEDALASAGQANDKFAWRTDAINIYVVNEIAANDGRKAAGKCSFPGGSDHSEIIAIANTLDGTLAATWLHEIGHYLDLLHTFECFDPNTPCDPDICTQAGDQCADVCPNRRDDEDDDNIMSYEGGIAIFGIDEDLTPCQIGIMNEQIFGEGASRAHVVIPCGNFCADEKEACRTDCNSAESSCVAPCRVAGKVCSDACGVKAVACRGGCVAVRGTCRAACEVPCLISPNSKACRDCRNACDNARDFCNNGCDSDERRCKSVCTATQNLCEGVCTGISADCRENCDASGTSCNADCARFPAPTATPTGTRRPTPTPTVGPITCAGDCDGGGSVTVDEILTMTNVALEVSARAECFAGDTDGDFQITVDEILKGIFHALNGCPAG